VENKLETRAIARGFRQFSRKQPGDFRHAFPLCAVPLMVRAVINIFSLASISNEARPFQLGKMTGDARLAHAQNLL